MEILLSEKLKGVCDQKNTETNPMKRTRIVHELGKIYRQKSPNKLCLVKSSILYNATLTRKPENAYEIKKI